MRKTTGRDRKNQPDDLKKQSRDNSIAEGAFHAGTQGFGESFIVPFAVKMGSTSTQLGFLRSFPAILGALFQLFSVAAVEKLKSRKKLVLYSTLAETCIWIPLLLNVLFWKSPLVLIVLFSAYAMLSAFITPLWSSWLSELVDEKERGVFFGKRNKIVGAAAFVCVFLAGIYLNQAEKLNPLSIKGFAFLFGIAFVARLISAHFIKRMHEPEYIVRKETSFTLGDFIRRIRYNNFGVFVIYLAAMAFAVSLASPFFAAYMLDDLKFNFISYTLITCASSIIAFLTLSFWGKHADRFGNKKLYTICGLLIPFVPFLWAIPGSFFHSGAFFIAYLMVVEIFSGFAWAGFDLTSSNFIYDSVQPEKRTRIISYYTLMNGIAIFLGASTGGFLLLVLKPWWIFASKYQIIFLLSGILRLAISLAFLSKIREVRIVERPHGIELFWNLLSMQGNKNLVNRVANPKQHAESKTKERKSIKGRLQKKHFLKKKDIGRITEHIRGRLAEDYHIRAPAELAELIDGYAAWHKRNARHIKQKKK